MPGRAEGRSQPVRPATLIASPPGAAPGPWVLAGSVDDVTIRRRGAARP